MRRAKTEFENVLLIVEIAFAFLVSAAKCKRSFSTLKRIKTDSKASIGDESVENLMRTVLEVPTGKVQPSASDGESKHKTF